MAAVVTRAVLEGYLNCPLKGHLRLSAGPALPSDHELSLRQASSRVERPAFDRLHCAAGTVLRDCTVTADTLRSGVTLLLNVTVEGEGFSVCFDALRRVPVPSGLGSFSYVPVLCQELDGPTRGPRLLLELLGLVLGSIQEGAPEYGFLYHGPECREVRLKLHPTNRPVRRLLDQIRALPGAERPPRLILNSHCPRCEFRDQCLAEAKGRDDLSLLRGMSAREVEKWGRRGIFTVAQLACTFRARRRKLSSGRQPHQHALQAKAVIDQKIYVLGTPTLPDSTGRIYLDLEGDPDRGFVYLAGLQVVDTGREERISVWADTPDEDAALFGRIVEVVDRYPDAPIYTYGSYEATNLRRMARVAGRTDVAERLSPRLVNVLSIIHAHVYFPTYSNGLKEIAGHLGFRWTTPGASGAQSIDWRRRWEETRGDTLKDLLTVYNQDDCAALRLVTETVHAICVPPTPGAAPPQTGPSVPFAKVDGMDQPVGRRSWGPVKFEVADFSFVNERAYFDYQRDRVYIRTSGALKKVRARRLRAKRKKRLRANSTVELLAESCPGCGGTELTRKADERLYRIAVDLRITRSGIRRRVIRFTTARYRCQACERRFVPREYRRLQVHFHALKAWAMYKHVAHRMSFENIADEIRECFGLPVVGPNIYECKLLLSRYYAETYRQLLTNVARGTVVHADETEVDLKGGRKGYVWVLTNMEEVVFVYRESREGVFVQDLLKDFCGVLVSDFYAAYDSLECGQQKCLVHLIRDFNHDIQRNPWDEELKALAADFGRLLRRIVATVDRHGLTARHLGRHQTDVDRFFHAVSDQVYQSEVAEGYRKRLLKYRAKLFTFLGHDGVPWNNNNAEHAIKQFAYYRETTKGMLTEAGLAQFLVLLSVRVSCKYKGVSFLKFMLSGGCDIDAFRAGGGRAAMLPAVQVLPDGYKHFQRNRRVSGDSDGG
jgi:predicted RecB family nuclease